MGYYISDYLNELYKKDYNYYSNLGKYEINSYITTKDYINGFVIEAVCKELNLKVNRELGTDIKLSAFPNNYPEIKEVFKELAEEVFENCKHTTIKKNEDETILCLDCNIIYSIYDEKTKDFEILEIN